MVNDDAFQPLPPLDDYDIPSDIDIAEAAPIPLDVNMSELILDMPSADVRKSTLPSRAAQDASAKPTRIRAKLDATRLMSDRGLPLLKSEAPGIRYLGKGHEAEDLDKMLQYYQRWMHQLFPKMTFMDGVRKVEKICHEKRMKVALHTWREEWRKANRPFHDEEASDGEFVEEEVTKEMQERPEDGIVSAEEGDKAAREQPKIRRVLRRANDALAREMFGDTSEDENENVESQRPRFDRNGEMRGPGVHEALRERQSSRNGMVQDFDEEPLRDLQIEEELAAERRRALARQILASSSSEDEPMNEHHAPISQKPTPSYRLILSDSEDDVKPSEANPTTTVTYGKQRRRVEDSDENMSH